MKYLGTLGFILYRLRLQNHHPNSGTKSTYSTWITLPKPPVAEKSDASFTDQMAVHEGSFLIDRACYVRLTKSLIDHRLLKISNDEPERQRNVRN